MRSTTIGTIANICFAVLGIALAILGVPAMQVVGTTGGLIVIAFGLLIVLMSGGRLLWLLRRMTSKVGDSDVTQCQRCGYDLRHQPVPRCPECGALIGFEKSADELGIDEHELQHTDMRS